jgi:hypothetical protein
VTEKCDLRAGSGNLERSYRSMDGVDASWDAANALLPIVGPAWLRVFAIAEVHP